MTAIDFLRDGKVGDKVHDPRFGDGVLEKFNKAYRRPICVRYKHDHTEQYGANGMWGGAHMRPILCWGHRGVLDQGEPPERIEYPLVMALSNSSLIVEFTDAKTAKVLAATSASDPIGVIGHAYTEHTNTDCWKPCERPVWMPTKPTWCYVKGDYCVRLIYRINQQGQYVDSQCRFWTEAEPCASKDIPDWWPKEWV